MRSLLIFLSILLFVSLGSNAQTLISLSPNSQPAGGEYVNIVILGSNTHFKNGISRADFGSGITVESLSVTNNTTASATILVSASATVGARTVKITTGTEVVTGTGMFNVFAPTGGTFEATITLLPIETINLKNIDLTNPSATPVLFYTDVYNTNTTRKVNLSLSLSNSAGLLGTMTLKNQPLSPNQHVTYSNRQYTSVNLNGAAGNNFLATVELTGTFPPDNYIYEIVVTDSNGTVLGTSSATNVISNPIVNPELITPGLDFTNNIQEEYLQFPLFQWFGQNDKYDFAIYFYLNGQTDADVVRNLPVYQQKGITGNSLLYPNFAEKLINGKTYAWQVLGEVVTASGIQYMPSNVFRFTYVEPGTTKNIVSSINIIPQDAALYVGQQVQFSALFFDQNGVAVANVTPTWQVTPSTLGTITPDGLFTATQPGTMAVLVSAGIATQYATVTVNPAPNNNATEDWLIDGMLQQLFGLPNP